MVNWCVGDTVKKQMLTDKKKKRGKYESDYLPLLSLLIHDAHVSSSCFCLCSLSIGGYCVTLQYSFANGQIFASGLLRRASH